MTPSIIMPSGLNVFYEGTFTLEDDPAHERRPLGETEGYLTGCYGTLVFDILTGATLRYYVQEQDVNPKRPHGEYSDIVKVDVETYRNPDGKPFQPGDGEDVCYIGQWTDTGEYLAVSEHPSMDYPVYYLGEGGWLTYKHKDTPGKVGLSAEELDAKHGKGCWEGIV